MSAKARQSSSVPGRIWTGEEEEDMAVDDRLQQIGW